MSSILFKFTLGFKVLATKRNAGDMEYVMLCLGNSVVVDLRLGHRILCYPAGNGERSENGMQTQSDTVSRSSGYHFWCIFGRSRVQVLVPESCSADKRVIGIVQ